MDSNISKEKYEAARRLIQAFKDQQTIPQPLEIPDYVNLKEVTTHYIDLVRRGKIGDDDFKQEVFVAALESIFGKDVWAWVNENVKDGQ
jgi:hypothetical protein